LATASSSKLSGKTILITGASMGIGEHLAREFAAQGASLILVARSADKLKALSEELSALTDCRYEPCDLGEPAAVEALIQRLQRLERLDGLVLNAGIGIYGNFEGLEDKDIRRLFEVNFFSGLALIRGLLPALKKGRQPRIMTVSSIVGWRAIARLNVYSASKSAIDGFVEALRIELKPHGVGVTNTYPPRVRTDFTANAKSVGWRPFATDTAGQDPRVTARRMLRGYLRGKRDVYLSFSNRLLIWGNFLFPGLIDWGLDRYFRKQS
jgi:short-subunit dehydrogenase